MTYLKKGNVHQESFGQIKVLSLLNILRILLIKKELNYITLKMKKKSSIVERRNKTMKHRMFKMFSVNNNTVY